jgi:uroporphyrinogen decarboxylase
MAEAMTSRERVLAAARHQQPDRVPIDFGGRVTGIHLAAHRDLMQHLGLDGGEESLLSYMTQIVDADPRLKALLGSDVVTLPTRSASTYEMRIEPETHTYADEWGVVYSMPPGGYYYDPVRFPLANAEALSDLSSYKWPSPTDPYRWRESLEQARQIRAAGDKAILLAAPTLGIWLLPQFLMGMEKALMDLAFNLALAEAIAEQVTEWYETFWDTALAEIGPYVDFIHMEGDLGDQNGPIFSPRLFRQIYKPRLRRVIDVIKKRTNAQIWLHACGSVYWVIPDLIDVGVQVLNPVQVSAAEMDSARLKREFGRDLTFWGGGCDPSVLQFGTPDDVEREVLRRIADFSLGGGFVFASIHNIQVNVPPANIVRMYETALRS